MTNNFRTGALFYAADLPIARVERIARQVDEPVTGDVVEFTDEAGGEIARVLGVPFLDGMDEIRVDAAGFALRALPRPTDVTYRATNAPGGMGVVISIDRPGRLRKVEIRFKSPVVNAPALIRVVLRPGSGGDFGPPVFAAPAFPKPGEMFGAVLGGMSAEGVSEGGTLLTVPPQLGNSWLIQVASASDDDGAAKLVPLAVAPEVRRVVVDALPDSLNVALAGPDGDVGLWSHPGLLLPEAGPRPLSFVPLAGKQLSATLRTAPTGTPVLPLTLKFSCASASKVEVRDATLTATYLVKPLIADPLTIRLDGDWTPFTLRAPTALTPGGGTVDLEAKQVGRALNGGTPEPGDKPPGRGLRLNVDRSAAVALPFLPRDGEPAGGVLPLVSVRVLVAAVEDAEAVLEIRADAAGAPGAVLTAPAVKSLRKGDAAWLEFVLKTPLPVRTADAPLWPTLRLNRGEVLWFADDHEPSGAWRVSHDRGATWDAPTSALAPGGRPLAQLFHALDDPLPAPAIQFRIGNTILSADLLAGAARRGPREHSLPGLAWPDDARRRLNDTAGTGRGATEFLLFSRSVLDLTLRNARLSYDPFRSSPVGRFA